MDFIVEGLREETDAHRAKVNAAQALLAAGVHTLPEELASYFGCEFCASVDVTTGLEVDLRTSGAVFDAYNVSGHEVGIDVDLTKLPKGVSRLRISYV